MSRLVLHIGTHKTATTRLQKMFHKNRALLERHGVIFPQIGPAEGQHALVGLWNPHMLRHGPSHGPSETPFDPRRAWANLAETYAATDHTVFLSSEEFSRMNARQVNLVELRRLVAGFDQVQILCTLRNQASFLQSVYQQISGSRRTGTLRHFIGTSMQQRLADGLPLDYNRFYTHLLRSFGAEQIRFVSYDAAVRQEGGIVGAYLRELGLPLRTEDLAPVSRDESNISPQPLATLHANRMAAPAVAPASLVALLQHHLEASFGPQLRSTLFSPAELEWISAIFTPLNALLSDRISPWQPGFQIGPMLGGGANLHRDDLTEAFWLEVCRAFAGGAG